jgi:AraC-like DNA-binding protein
MKILLQNKYPFQAPNFGSLHSHPFWQLDYYENVSGLKLKLEDKTLSTNDKVIILVPSYAPHSIATLSKCICYAIKFEADDTKFSGIKSGLIPYGEYEDTFNRIFEMMPVKNDIEKEILENYLSILLLKINQKNGFSASNGTQGDSRIAASIDYIESNLLEKLTAEKLSNAANMSTTHFTRLFQKEIGVTPMRFIRKKKIEKAEKMLLFSDFNVSQIADALSYPDLHTFSRAFKKETGKSPSLYRDKEFSKTFKRES